MNSWPCPASELRLLQHPSPRSSWEFSLQPRRRFSPSSLSRGPFLIHPSHRTAQMSRRSGTLGSFCFHKWAMTLEQPAESGRALLVDVLVSGQNARPARSQPPHGSQGVHRQTAAEQAQTDGRSGPQPVRLVSLELKEGPGMWSLLTQPHTLSPSKW